MCNTKLVNIFFKLTKILKHPRLAKNLKKMKRSLISLSDNEYTIKL